MGSPARSTSLPARVAQLFDTFYRAQGRLEGALRTAISARAAGEPGADLPSGPLAAWVDKVAREADRCEDADLAALRAAGLDEDQIYEATVAAAFGAARARFERGLAVLRAR